MKPLYWVTLIALVAGVAFAIDGVASWPSGSVLTVDPDRYRESVTSLTIGSTLIGIGVLAGLLALHARAVGQLTRAALLTQAQSDRHYADEARRQESAARLRVDRS